MSNRSISQALTPVNRYFHGIRMRKEGFPALPGMNGELALLEFFTGDTFWGISRPKGWHLFDGFFPIIRLSRRPARIVWRKMALSEDCASQLQSNEEWLLLAEFSAARDTCHETGLVERVLEAVRGIDLPPTKLIQVREAVIASLGSAEKAPQDASISLDMFRIWVSASFSKQASGPSPVVASHPDPAQSSWGFFLTRRRLTASTSGECYLIELFLYLEGASDDRPIS